MRRPLELKSPYLTGPDIVEVQRALGKLEPDGVFGPLTAARIEDWKWEVGYEARALTPRLGYQGLAWLFGERPWPPAFRRRAQERAGKPRPAANGIFPPLTVATNPRSEFAILDAEGAPAKDGRRYHAAKDWFAPGGSPVRAPVRGRVVEVRPSRGNRGQIFGGTVKIEAATGKRVWVFRHVDPRDVREGQTVQRGKVVAAVTNWVDGADHVHIELWRALAGGYSYENMIDPMTVLKAKP
jgi:murein DD-endopeptidase MepM/ murein hydrolase activator NlpD